MGRRQPNPRKGYLSAVQTLLRCREGAAGIAVTGKAEILKVVEKRRRKEINKVKRNSNLYIFGTKLF
jgi:hypothetical protein